MTDWYNDTMPLEVAYQFIMSSPNKKFSLKKLGKFFFRWLYPTPWPPLWFWSCDPPGFSSVGMYACGLVTFISSTVEMSRNMLHKTRSLINAILYNIFLLIYTVLLIKVSTTQSCYLREAVASHMFFLDFFVFLNAQNFILSKLYLP